MSGTTLTTGHGMRRQRKVTAQLISGGDILHVEGGYRGKAGCFYQISGADGVAAALAACTGMEDVCPVWFVCKMSDVPPPGLHNACGNSSHLPGSSEHPEYKLGELQSWTRDIKLSDYRVMWDCSEDGNCTWTAFGASKGKQCNGKGKGKQAKGKGKGKGKIRGGKGGI